MHEYYILRIVDKDVDVYSWAEDPGAADREAREAAESTPQARFLVVRAMGSYATETKVVYSEAGKAQAAKGPAIDGYGLHGYPSTD